jgi:hypothetical protein
MASSPHDFSHPDSVKNARSVILKFAMVKEIFAGGLVEDISRRLLPEFVGLCRGDYSEVLYDVALYLETQDIKHIELHCWSYERRKIMNPYIKSKILSACGSHGSNMCAYCDDFIRTGEEYVCLDASSCARSIAARLRIARHPVVISRLTDLLKRKKS